MLVDSPTSNVVKELLVGEQARRGKSGSSLKRLQYGYKYGDRVVEKRMSWASKFVKPNRSTLIAPQSALNT